MGQFHVVSSHLGKRQENFCMSKIDADVVRPAVVECLLVLTSVSTFLSRPVFGFVALGFESLEVKKNDTVDMIQKK